MSILSRIQTQLAAMAVAAVQAAASDGVELVGKIVQDPADAGQEVVDEFEKLVGQLGSIAVQKVTALWNDTSLTGLEKANLAATQLVQHAAANGIIINAGDVTTLVKNAYLEVKQAVSNLLSGFASA